MDRRSSDDGTRRWRGALLAVAACASVVVGCVCVWVLRVEALHVDSALVGTDVPPPLEKWTSLHGDCSLKTFIALMPCKKSSRGGACCHAMQHLLDQHCLCKPVPGIVSGHGGTVKNFLRSFMQCNLTDGVRDPVDYASESHECVDQSAWCADRRHGKDLRLDSFLIGRAQMWNGHRHAWEYITPAWRGDDGELQYTNELETAEFICRATGYAGLQVHKDEFLWGYAEPLNSNKTVHHALSCGPDALEAGDIKLCNRSSVGHRLCSNLRRQGIEPCHRGPMWVRCSTSHHMEPELCMRPNQHGRKSDTRCAKRDPEAGARGVFGPFGDEDHVRAVAAPHMVCGSAGINESRINWFDGFVDDDRAYVRSRPHVYTAGGVGEIEEWLGALPGHAFEWDDDEEEDDDDEEEDDEDEDDDYDDEDEDEEDDGDDDKSAASN